MKRVTAIATTVFLALLVALNLNSATAQDLNPSEKTFLTFSGPVELPGMTLPAGTYTFRLADTPGRNVVQVFSQDEKDIHGQFLFVQANRRDATGDTVVTFRETTAGTTPAVQYWYYPGETIGKEFVYPKDQAMKIAARTNSTVLSTDGAITAESRVSSVDSSGQVTEWQRETQVANPVQPAVPAQPTAAAGSLAGNRGVVEQPVQPEIRSEVPAESPVATSGQVEAQGQVAAAELPRTASPLPLAGLIGLLSLAGGLGLRALRH